MRRTDGTKQHFKQLFHLIVIAMDDTLLDGYDLVSDVDNPSFQFTVFNRIAQVFTRLIACRIKYGCFRTMQIFTEYTLHHHFIHGGLHRVVEGNLIAVIRGKWEPPRLQFNDLCLYTVRRHMQQIETSLKSEFLTEERRLQRAMMDIDSLLRKILQNDPTYLFKLIFRF
ncbi:hypothetical protein SDC9_199092 [bioreactor metagenome]|uniref:Uncharacterized protein n=1 Tax=bioreactor metagenome TaxID=1076179 RepID=A0A645IKA9_9ZZZZ